MNINLLHSVAKRMREANVCFASPVLTSYSVENCTVFGMVSISTSLTCSSQLSFCWNEGFAMELRKLEILPLWKGDLTFKCELSHSNPPKIKLVTCCSDKNGSRANKS